MGGTRTLFYHDFPDKDAVTSAVIDDYTQDYIEALAHWNEEDVYKRQLFGCGIGRGMPTFIPEVQSDFIFSAIAEEMGLLGASGVIFLFMLFAVRGFLTAARAKSDMAAFTAVGLTTSICLQAFIIIGGVTGFIPLTGLTLPFMSQGGSSLLSSFIIVGLLLCACLLYTSRCV